ncbi:MULTISPECIES: LPXTG cell wall anchor domain-containing protein [unclassified Streptomyces]|uniref:LPXTG cell wall anchor domain-containing protein n=1 Tax=unclassified Streptomyces TaxID=2593676 RepID=UPI001F04FEDE|nr:MULTISPECIES: LPXTG cell wall anchor domain-containing protein [unclassified Streptomyces]MCH0566733.1 LPXTG cell wall anchor domain-containing protein [Streptomyces sp. MUM 2J]MCH0569988.1 LPXTG cell wall anchor domain-containing protein [Streptomyces sp. MUM 136J]
MSSRHTAAITGSLAMASFSAMVILTFTAHADDQQPGSSKGGKVVDRAPEGVEITTLLPERISVDNSSHKTAINATVKNEGTRDSGDIRLLVVGFEGLEVHSVKGCSVIAEKDLPKGSNSGFSCPVGSLAAGASKSYEVDAAYDLSKAGKICLPVQSGDGKKTFWQQGPVPFGTTNPSPNAPATPLLLGTDNKPVAPDGDSLPKTGVGSEVLPLGAAGAGLVAAGAAGLWWTQRRRPRRG